jgi:hypothetical protein
MRMCVRVHDSCVNRFRSQSSSSAARRPLCTFCCVRQRSFLIKPTPGRIIILRVHLYISHLFKKVLGELLCVHKRRLIFTPVFSRGESYILFASIEMLALSFGNEFMRLPYGSGSVFLSSSISKYHKWKIELDLPETQEKILSLQSKMSFLEIINSLMRGEYKEFQHCKKM